MSNIYDQIRTEQLQKVFGDGLQVSATYSFQKKMNIIAHNIEKATEQKVDWLDNLNAYYASAEYISAHREVNGREDMREITVDDLRTMLEQEQRYTQKAEAFRECVKQKAYFEAARLCGLWGEEKEPLFRWLFAGCKVKEPFTEDKVRNLMMAVIQLDGLFCDGEALSFPIVEKIMTQPHREFYYRGERTVYGSCRPTFFRNNSGLPREAQILIMNAKLHEACHNLDRIDVISRWNNVARVNYLGICQHYGLWTPMIDITNDLKSALFFACCRFEGDGWRPLTSRDIEDDSTRYGVLFRKRVEIDDLQWCVDENTKEAIAPIGHQPFMRCVRQHAFMTLVFSPDYDLYHNPSFEKLCFAHDVDFCRWIFDICMQGDAIYPSKDGPSLESWFAQINQAHSVLRRHLEECADSQFEENPSPTARQMLLDWMAKQLDKAGYAIDDRNERFVNQEWFDEINRKYLPDRVEELDATPLSDRPIISIG